MELWTTRSSRPEPAARRQGRSQNVCGFTLVELLVVMGIIVVLAALLLPMASRAHQSAVRANMQSDLMAISQALEAYHNDFGDYPRTGLASKAGSTNPVTRVTGAAVLCWALIAPGPASQDGNGANGGSTSGTDYGAPGFRIRAGTEVKGPYLSPDRFRVGTVALTPQTINATVPVNTVMDDTACVLGDRYGNVILYYPANPGVSPQTGYVGNYAIGAPQGAVTQWMFNYGDNSQPYTSPTLRGVTELTPRVMAIRLGLQSAALPAGAGKPNYKATSTDVPINAPYVLWSAGPDAQFGPQIDSLGNTTGQDDDVTYPDLSPVPLGIKP